MAYVSALKRSQKRPDRVHVFIDEKFWAAMNTDCLVELGWYVGRNLEPQEIVHAEQKVMLSEALRYCFRVLGQRARSSGQLRKGMLDRDFPAATAEAALLRLQQLLLIDDEQYAQNVYESAVRRGLGMQRIALLFESKYLPQSLLASLASEDEDFWVDQAQQAASRHFKDMSSVAKPKVLSWLLRRGFSFGQANQALQDFEFASFNATQKSKPVDQDKLVAAVRRRYPQAGSVYKEKSKAWAFLARKGAGTQQIKEILEAAFE